MAVRIVSLTARLGLDGTGFQQGLSRAGSQMRTFTSGLKSTMASTMAGAFSTVAIIQQAKAMVDYGSKIADMSKKLGVSTDALQEMEHAGKMSGASIEDIANAFRALSKSREQALASGRMGGFTAFGIDRATLAASSLEQLMGQIAQHVQQFDLGSSELAKIEEVLGRSGGTLIPMMVEGLASAREEARKLGAVLDAETIQALDRAGDSVDKLALRTKKPMAEMTANLANFAGVLFNLVDRFASGYGAWLGGMLGTQGNLSDRFKGAVEARQAILADIAKANEPAASTTRTKVSSEGVFLSDIINEQMKKDKARGVTAAGPGFSSPVAAVSAMDSLRQSKESEKDLKEIARTSTRQLQILEEMLRESRTGTGKKGPFGTQ